MSIDQYSTTPASNDLVNYFKTGMRPSAVKNAGWDIMADIASYAVNMPRAGGSANALTVTNGRPFGSLAVGLLQVVNPVTPNTGPTTFAPDGLPQAHVVVWGIALAGGELQPGVPAFLKYDGTAWNLLNPAVPGRNLFVDPCCRVAQIGTAGKALSTTYQYGSVDLVACKATGTAVSAGTITQDTAVSSGTATPYAVKLTGATITGTGKVFFGRFIESRDSQALNGLTVLFSCLVKHDVGSNINAFLTLSKFQSQDSPGTPTQLATGSGSPVSVANNAWTPVTLAYTFGSSDGSNGLELILEMDCGAITTKDFEVTDWQCCIGTLAQKCVVPRFADDISDCRRYYEQSYEYGTAPGTITTNGRVQCVTALQHLGGGLVLELAIRFTVDKFGIPNPNAYSPITGASGQFRDGNSGTDKAATLSICSTSIELTNGGGGIASGSPVQMHWTVDSRLVLV